MYMKLNDNVCEILHTIYMGNEFTNVYLVAESLLCCTSLNVAVDFG